MLCDVFICPLDNLCCYFSDMRIYYLSTTSTDGTDSECERLGWKRLQEYNPAQRRWKYLDSLAEGNSMQEDYSFEDELDDSDYYPSLPFAAFFSFCKVLVFKTPLPILFVEL